MGAQEQEEGECGPVVKRRKAAAGTDVSMELDFLDCPVCFHPLRPPIFQCAVGHVVCSSCLAKLPDRCHCCSLTTGYNRCYIIEHVVDSTKVPCSYDNLGCTQKITYYEKEDHEKVCPHAPCFCPETGCSFSGSTMMLLDHFSAKHKWHSASARLSYNKAFRIHISLGSTVLQSEEGHLFLVNMVLESLGGCISVFCVQPHITKSNFECRLIASCPEMSYSQVTQFQTRSTNLFDALPKDCFLFVAPKVLLRGTGTNVTAMVSVTLIPP
uniref:RING-type E3 ubiquitin transferase n=1 Tax=Arundo donax TaxID=35708 RepID=A0A0A9FGD6_ARUDO